MPNYGYMVWQFQAHHHGKSDEPLRLGTLADPELPGDAGKDALDLLYAIVHGLSGHAIEGGNQHFTVQSAFGVGRCIKFTYELGRSGQESQIRNPRTGGEPFTRTAEHIEGFTRRGMLIVPDKSIAGLLVLEAHGRGTGKHLLVDELKRAFRAADPADKPVILNFAAAVDAHALAEYLAEAEINTIKLRRKRVPKDFADELEMDPEEQEAGQLEMQVRGLFKKGLLRKIQQNADARKRMLLVDGLQFDELNVQVQVGSQKTTLSVTGDQAPSFVYLIGADRPTDDAFYASVVAGVPDIAKGAGVRTGDRWATAPWSAEKLALKIAKQRVGERGDGEP